MQSFASHELRHTHPGRLNHGGGALDITTQFLVLDTKRRRQGRSCHSDPNHSVAHLNKNFGLDNKQDKAPAVPSFVE